MNTETKTTIETPEVAAMPENTTEETKKEGLHVVDTIVELGASWAAFGLNLGKAALRQSAKTLETTAHALEKFAHTVEEKAAPAEKVEEKREETN